MTERSKNYLKQEFRDGERPTGTDFSDLIDSFMSKVDDLVNVDTNGNLTVPGGLNLGTATTGQAGTLRFSGGQLQVFDGATWNNVGGGAGAFLPVAGGPNVAFAAGNVGIGTFATAPVYKLEINLGNNTDTGQRVRFGNAVISNGQGASQSAAQFAHQGSSADNTSFALRQGSAGDVNLNAPATQPITISHGRTQARLYIDPTGPVVIAGNALISPDPTITLQVGGDAGKTTGGSAWKVISDARFKKDVQPFEDGLNKLMEIRTVKFKYNGELNTNPDLEEVGIIGQEIGKIFPYMTSKSINPETGKQNDQTDKEVLMFNSSPLTYVMVNAIQELAQKVKDLQGQLDAKPRKSSQK